MLAPPLARSRPGVWAERLEQTELAKVTSKAAAGHGRRRTEGLAQFRRGRAAGTVMFRLIILEKDQLGHVGCNHIPFKDIWQNAGAIEERKKNGFA